MIAIFEKLVLSENVIITYELNVYKLLLLEGLGYVTKKRFGRKTRILSTEYRL